MTDEGNLPLPLGEVPGRGGEGDIYPLSRLRRQLPQSGSQGGRGERIATPVCALARNDMRDSIAPGISGGLPRQCELARNDNFYFGVRRFAMTCVALD